MGAQVVCTKVLHVTAWGSEMTKLRTFLWSYGPWWVSCLFPNIKVNIPQKTALGGALPESDFVSMKTRE